MQPSLKKAIELKLSSEQESQRMQFVLTTGTSSAAKSPVIALSALRPILHCLMENVNNTYNMQRIETQSLFVQEYYARPAADGLPRWCEQNPRRRSASASRRRASPTSKRSSQRCETHVCVAQLLCCCCVITCVAAVLLICCC